MDIKFKKYKSDIATLASKYIKAEESINEVEKEIARLRNIKDLVSDTLNGLKSEESNLINKIEEETGEKVTPALLVSILKDS